LELDLRVGSRLILELELDWNINIIWFQFWFLNMSHFWNKSLEFLSLLILIFSKKIVFIDYVFHLSQISETFPDFLDGFTYFYILFLVIWEISRFFGLSFWFFLFFFYLVILCFKLSRYFLWFFIFKNKFKCSYKIFWIWSWNCSLPEAIGSTYRNWNWASSTVGSRITTRTAPKTNKKSWNQN